MQFLKNGKHEVSILLQQPGEFFELKDPGNFYGPSVLSGKYTGDAITIPMANGFSVFLLLREASSKNKGDASDNSPKFGMFINVFDPRTKTLNIDFGLEEEAGVKLEVFSVKGELIKRLLDTSLPIGNHSAVWDGRNNSNTIVTSGIYVLQLTAGGRKATKKVVVLKK